MRDRGPIVAGVIAVLVALLAVFFLVLPKVHQVSEARSQLQQAQQQQSTLEAQLKALQEVQANAPQIQKQLAKLETQVPPTADLPGMIRLLQGAADSSGIDFFSVSPGQPTTDASGAFSIIPTAITVNGEFFSLDEFLFRLQTLPRAVKVTSFTVGEGPDFITGGPTEPLELTISLTAEFYTTDASAGPGSAAGPTSGSGGLPSAPVPTSPAPSTNPSGSTTPSATATSSGSAAPTSSPTQGG